MRVLGIETTCDETAAAVVALGGDGRGEILSNEILSQIAEHAAYGGVVPEIAARAHVEVVDRLIARALATAGDAIGEAFDKVAKLLGLAYPGGPQVEREAASGNPERFAFPRPMLGRPNPDFSLSGLKTAVRLEAERIAPLTQSDVADL